jgi:hypothetical protein
MRCKTCDYPLWNLPARKCPECGTSFAPSDFHFRPNAVQFCCPHCDQPYYGTGEHGHLVPSEFNCVTCGQRIAMDQCVLRPAEGVKEEQAQIDIMPWLERSRRGWFRGWWKTVGMAMVAPPKLMRAVPVDSGVGEAWMFAFITHVLTLAAGGALPAAIVSLFAFAAGGGNDAWMLLGLAASWLIGGTIVIMLGAAVWGLVTHGMLRITGGCAHGLGRTYHAILYSSGANVPWGIPCIGPYCGSYMIWIWWLVSAILMICQGQRVRGGRATLCVGMFPLVMVALIIASYFGFIYFIFSQARTSSAAFAAMGYQPITEASSIGSALSTWATQHNGQFPPHALQLVADGHLSAPEFAMWQIGHDEAKVPVAGTTLDSFQRLGPNRQQLAAQSAAASLPPNVVAHRLGDVVFTYHGLNANTADSQLWIAIVHPDPDQLSNGTITACAIRADGIPLALPRPTFTSQLAQQNALRQQYGLPPLPDPATVTHVQPATKLNE